VKPLSIVPDGTWEKKIQQENGGCGKEFNTSETRENNTTRKLYISHLGLQQH
jgi:hypothetical protein